MSAGSLRERVTFQRRALVSDGYGNQQGAFEDQFTVAARIRPRLGGEAVLAARLAGTQPVTITVRWDVGIAQVTPEWRVVDARKGTVYNIRTMVNPDERRRFVDMIAESGGAT